MKKNIRILIADDHAIVRMGIASLLEMETDLVIVGQAEDGAAAVRMAQQLRPDIVIMDLMMPVMDGVTATAELVRRAPESKAVVLTSFSTSDGIAHALEAGAVGAVLKSAAETELIPAIRKVAAGETYVSQEVKSHLKKDPPVPKLSARQLEILKALVDGQTSKEISRSLHIGFDSVNEHISLLVQKIGAANRTEAVAIALRKHLLKI